MAGRGEGKGGCRRYQGIAAAAASRPHQRWPWGPGGRRGVDTEPPRRRRQVPAGAAPTGTGRPSAHEGRAEGARADASRRRQAGRCRQWGGAPRGARRDGRTAGRSRGGQRGSALGWWQCRGRGTHVAKAAERMGLDSSSSA